MDFVDVVRARRSCRKYTSEPVSSGVIEKALDEALIAPTSSNMQLWNFYWVNSAEKKQALAEACFNQSAAKTAQELVVVLADWSHWRENQQRMVTLLKEKKAAPAALTYYEKLVPLMYSHGPFNVFGYLKKLSAFFVGFFRPTPRGPHTREDLAMVAVKSAALACENFMLSIYNQGYACCPMEGFDEVRVMKILGLSTNTARVTMIISVGKADPSGIFGSQFRFDKSHFIHKI